MTGTEAKSSVRVAGEGRGATRARKIGIPRRVGTPFPRLADLAAVTRRAARVRSALIGTLAGVTVSFGISKGESQVRLGRHAAVVVVRLSIEQRGCLHVHAWPGQGAELHQ